MSGLEIAALIGTPFTIVMLVFVAYKWGRISKEKETTEAKAKVKDEQANIAVNRPSSLTDSLRDGKF